MARGLTWTLPLAPRRAQDGKTPLHWAVMSGKVACVKVLVEAGANKEAIGKSNVKPSPRPSPPGLGLGVAWRIGRRLTCGRVPRRTQYGRTPLHWAAKEGDVECMRALVDAGANKEAKDNVRLPPRTSLAPLLPGWDLGWHIGRAGADTLPRTTRTQFGKTPLHVAAFNGEVKCVKVLVEAGANKDATTKVRPPSRPSSTPLLSGWAHGWRGP